MIMSLFERRYINQLIGYYLYHTGTDNGFTDHVATLQLGSDGVIFKVRILYPHNCFMEVWIEFLTFGFDDLQPLILQRLHHLTVYHLYAFFKIFGIGCLRSQCPLEIVHNG